VTPGLESPTISPLADPEWVAVRAMVPRASMNRVMDHLYDIGARAILVTDIAACRI
jgi:ATP phosphoribosyltransferase